MGLKEEPKIVLNQMPYKRFPNLQDYLKKSHFPGEINT